MKSVRNCALLLLLLTAPLAATQAAGLYKWTDDEGNVHYDQLPPSGRTSQKLKPPKDVAAAEASQPKKEEDAIPEDAKRNADELKVKRQNCEIAKGNMQTYKDSQKIRQADGTIVEMSDEMREAKIKEAQKMIDNYCS